MEICAKPLAPKIKFYFVLLRSIECPRFKRKISNFSACEILVIFFSKILVKLMIFIKAFRPFVFLRTWDLLSDSGNAECGVNSRKTN